MYPPVFWSSFVVGVVYLWVVEDRSRGRRLSLRLQLYALKLHIYILSFSPQSCFRDDGEWIMLADDHGPSYDDHQAFEAETLESASTLTILGLLGRF